MTRHLDIPKSVIGELRLPDLCPITSKDITVRGPRGAESLRVDEAVVSENLCKAELHLTARFPPGGQAHPAGEALPEVEDVNTWCGRVDRDG